MLRRAFTVVELLVVIVIVAVLAGMLVPALARAAEEGQQASCTANIHAVGTAFEAFLQDHDGLYPGWVSDSIAEEYDQWVKIGKPEAAPTGGGPFYQLVDQGYLADVAARYTHTRTC